MKKITGSLLLLFIAMNGIVYYITELNQTEKIDLILDNNLHKLKTHYEILLHNQKIDADAIYISTIKLIPGVVELFTQAQTATKEERAVLREKLYNKLRKKYRLMQMRGVLQYQFVFPNNVSFLRVHKYDKFGDDLTDVRADFKYVNEKCKPIRGFSQGRTAHAFRNVYPISGVSGNHLGAIEISYSSDNLQSYLTNVSQIYTHFLVDKRVFDTNAWSREDLILKYMPSSEHKNYMLAMNKSHSVKICIEDNSARLASVRTDINSGIKKGKEFALYKIDHNEIVNIVSFFPIKDVKDNKVAAWLVSYTESPSIYKILLGSTISRVIFFILFAIIVYLVYRQILVRKEIVLDNQFVNDVLNSTDDIMFATDFKEVTFSNRRFRNFFNVTNEESFNQDIDLLNIFMEVDGCLHSKLLLNGESVPHFLSTVEQKDRVVCLLDSSLNKKFFNINITKTSQSEKGIFLVTLSDITKQRENEQVIHKKAYLDGLTGVYNRNKFDEVAIKEFKRDLRYKRDLSMAIVDIDHFKIFNDTYGHLVGDEVLILLAQYLNKSVRDTDVFARWGGEEFVILFPETHSEVAKNICDKLRQDIHQLSHTTAGGITASFGVTQYFDGDTLESMFERCDDALYEAKEKGRDRVCVL